MPGAVAVILKHDVHGVDAVGEIVREHGDRDDDAHLCEAWNASPMATPSSRLCSTARRRQQHRAARESP